MADPRPPIFNYKRQALTYDYPETDAQARDCLPQDNVAQTLYRTFRSDGLSINQAMINTLAVVAGQQPPAWVRAQK